MHPLNINQGLAYNDGNSVALMRDGKEIATIERHEGMSEDDFDALCSIICTALDI